MITTQDLDAVSNHCGMWMILPVSLMFAAIGAVSGLRKGRCLDGLLLGLFWWVVGLTILYYLPSKLGKLSKHHAEPSQPNQGVQQ